MRLVPLSLLVTLTEITMTTGSVTIVMEVFVLSTTRTYLVVCIFIDYDYHSIFNAKRMRKIYVLIIYVFHFIVLFIYLQPLICSPMKHAMRSNGVKVAVSFL